MAEAKTQIQLSKATVEKLKARKKYSWEPYEIVILRLLGEET